MKQTHKHILTVVLIAVFAVAGGSMSGRFFNAPDYSVPRVTNIYNPDGRLREEGEAYFGRTDKKLMDIGLAHGTPLQDFYDQNNALRMQFGIYLGDMRGDERGLPFASLNDNNGLLKLLLRLDRRNNAPLVILKDSKGANRVIMGLALYDEGQDPFLLYLDKDGTKHMVLGTFSDSTATGAKLW
jgi:hypothetical protein